jgi:kumamolisin
MKNYGRLKTVTVMLIAAVMIITSSAYVLSSAGNGTASGGGLTARQLINGPFTTSPYSEMPMIRQAQELGPAPSSMPMYITVSFSIRNSQQLAALITQQQTPGSPQYRHFLTLSQFEKEYGPTPQVYNETLAYFSAMGFIPVKTGTTMTIGFRSTASRVSSAFRTQIGLFRLSNGTVVYANSGPLALPTAIADSVASVNGLTDIIKVHPDLMQAPLSLRGTAIQVASTSSSDPVVYRSMAQAVNFTHPGFLYVNSSFPFGEWQFLNPSTMTVAYNATPLYSKGDMGQGTTIAVVMAEGYNPSDLASFAQMVYGNPNQILGRLTAYPVAGGTSNATSPGSTLQLGGDAFEFSLDIEYSSTMAPAAHIDAVYGPTLSTASLVSAYAELTTLNPLPNVITNSWGGSEDIWWNLYGPSWQSARALEDYFMQLTSMGSTILASSGDSGGYDSYSGLLSVSLPASSPYVVAVGGVQTTVGNLTGIQFPTPPQYVVNQTLAPYGFSEVDSYPAWFPNYPVNGSTVGYATQESYWYTPGASSNSPDYASGGIGLSYWFTQPWWQHGPYIPNTGRRMVPDIAAEANFNETVYFDGTWNFFWGGTSFAAPTVAGEFALLDSYLNTTIGSTPGRSSFYLGLAQPLLYNIGNDNHLPYSAYTQISSGNNSWDLYAFSQGYGWPGGQNWPVSSTGPAKGWNLLAGLGVPNIANLAYDANMLLNPSLFTDRLVVELDGQPLSAIAGNATYALTLYNTTTGKGEAGVPVNMTFISVTGQTTYISNTTNTTGGFILKTTGLHGYLALYSYAKGVGSGFQSVWISRPNLTAGQITVTVLGPRSIMGGFDFFNGYLSQNYPAIGSLMPNTVAVQVTYRATPASAPQPVYNAVVVATTVHEPYVSSPPDLLNPNYAAFSALNYTPVRSMSLTNLSGIAYVETWNVLQNENYTVSAYYLGLTNSTNFTVTPHFNIQALNSFSSLLGTLYGGEAGYLGNGAMNTIIAPSVASPDASYQLYVRVSYWNGNPAAFVPVDLAIPNLFSTPFSPESIPGTQTITNASGIAVLTINNLVSFDASLSQGILLVQAFNGSYPSVYLSTPSGMIPFQTNDSNAAILMLQPVYGYAFTSIQLSSVSTLSTSYIGTENATGSFYILTPVFYPLTDYNNITSLSYRIDSSAPVNVPLSSVGQEAFYWSFPLNGLSLGEHNITVEFNDSYGFTYVVQDTFYVIGAGVNPGPAVSFTSPSPGSYVSGQTTIDFRVTQSNYLMSETLTINQFSYNVMGMTSFSFNASSFGYGPLDISLSAVNYNGVSAEATMSLYAAPQPTPIAQITSPSPGEHFNSTSSITVGLYYSGDYLTGESLHLSGPSGNLTVNVTGMQSYTFSKLPSGTYHLTYTVSSADGLRAVSTSTFVIVTTPAEVSHALATTVSPVAYAIIAAAFIVGIVIGLVVERSRRRKPPAATQSPPPQ